MKLPKIQNKKLKIAIRLNRLVRVVTLLWLVITVVLLLLFRPGMAHAVEPHKAAHQEVAQIAPSMTARAFFHYKFWSS